MRTKEEILDSCRNDIASDAYKDNVPLWLECRRIEVLIDIRDTLENRLKSLDNTILKYVIPKENTLKKEWR